MIYWILLAFFVIASIGLLKDSKPRKVTIIRCPTCGDKAYLYEDGSWECTFCGDFGRMKK